MQGLTQSAASAAEEMSAAAQQLELGRAFS